MIKPASDIFSYTIPTDGLTTLVAHERTAENRRGNERIVFTRFKREYGIILVTAHPRDGMTKCECIIDGALHERWYYHTVSTTRQAALIVNRFLADLKEERAA